MDRTSYVRWIAWIGLRTRGDGRPAGLAASPVGGRPPHARGRAQQRRGGVRRDGRAPHAGSALTGGLMGQHRNSRLRTCGAALPSRLAGHGPRPVPGLSPGALPRASSDARALDVTWPVAPGCLSRPTGLRRRGAPHPGSHSGGTPSFARATDLGLPKTLGRLGKGSVIGFPNPRESSRPAVTTM